MGKPAVNRLLRVHPSRSAGAAMFLLRWLFKLSLPVALACAGAAEPVPITPLDAPFSMPELRRPVFPARAFSVIDYGAVGNGETLDTAAIQAAIDACHTAGGGRVVVPAGRWLTGPLQLKSRVDLHLAAGATLVFSDDKKLYFPAVAGTPSGGWSQNGLETGEVTKIRVPQPLISALDAEDIAITGPGTINGQGLGWWPLHKGWWPQARERKPDADAAYRHAWAGLDPELFPQRPQLVQPVRCRRVLLEGFTAVDGPFWMINPVACENVIIRGLVIRAAWPGNEPHTPNTDGIDPESCRNVLIEDCDIATGDDSIAIKAGRDAAGRERRLPCENLVIRRVTGRRIAIGSEMSGGVRHVLIRDCRLGGMGSLVDFRTRRGRGGVIEDIWIEDIAGGKINGPLVKVDMQFWTQVVPAPPEPVSERTPRIRRLALRHIRASGQPPGAPAVWLNGLPEMPIEDVVFDDLQAPAGGGVVAAHVRRATLDGAPVASLP